MNPKEAKKFLAQEILETAHRNNVDFDDLERQTLYWSADQEEDFLELGKIFPKKHNEDEFEKKVIKLFQESYDYNQKYFPEKLEKYKQSYKALHQGDHYLLVMLEDAMGNKFKPFGWFGGKSKSVSDYLKLVLSAFVFGSGILCFIGLVERGYGFIAWVAVSFTLAFFIHIRLNLLLFGVKIGVIVSTLLFLGWCSSYWAAEHFNLGKWPIKTAFGLSGLVLYIVEMGFMKYRSFFNKTKARRKF